MDATKEVQKAGNEDLEEVLGEEASPNAGVANVPKVDEPKDEIKSDEPKDETKADDNNNQPKFNDTQPKVDDNEEKKVDNDYTGAEVVDEDDEESPGCPLDRIGEIMLAYNKWMKNDKDIALLTAIDLLIIMNDYDLFRTCKDCKTGGHTVENVNDHIVTKFMDNKPCNMKDCPALKRNTRNRMAKENQYQQINDGKSKNTAKIQILDAIHCALLHAFDTGYKLNTSDLLKFERIEDENTIDCSDKSMGAFIQLLEMQVERYTNMRSDVNAVEHSKFMTYLEEVKDDSKNDSNLYTPGFIFFYGSKAENSTISYPSLNNGTPIGKFYIPFKYDSLKDEIMSNDLCKLDSETWNVISEKASFFLISKLVKKMKKLSIAYFTVNFDGYFNDIEELQVENILAVLLYCNFLQLSNEFMKTFRMSSETPEELNARHSNFARWGNALQQMFHFFSTIFADSEIEVFYHGISSQMLFKDVFQQFNSPISTTTNLLVALNFNREGMILELTNDKNRLSRFFPCQYFSDLKNEDECLFFSNFKFIRFHSIRHLVLKENYESYIKAMCILSNCITSGGLTPYKISSKYIDIIAQLINNKAGKKLIPLTDKKYQVKIPKYIMDMFNYSYENMGLFVLNGYKFVSGYHQFFKPLMPTFCNMKEEQKDEKKHKYPIFSFKYEIYFSLCSEKLTQLIFWYVPITKQLMDDVLNKVIVDPRLVNLVTVEFDSTQYYKDIAELSIKDVFEQYMEPFSQKGWDIVRKFATPAIPVNFEWAIIKKGSVVEEEERKVGGQ